MTSLFVSIKRMEIGEDKVQGLDYVYTIHLWLKALNHASLDKTLDPGHDGTNSTNNFAKDVFAMQLGYFTGDFSRSSSPFNTNTNNVVNNTALNPNSNRDLFDTRVSTWTTNNLHNPLETNSEFSGITGYQYRYDQLNRLKEARQHTDVNVVANNQWGTGTAKDAYGVALTYDANGNILTLTRNDQTGASSNLDEMDDLAYTYETIGTRKTNRLIQVVESATVTGGNDIQPGTLLFEYDEIGNLRRDVAEQIDNIEWSVYGKVLKVERNDQNHVDPSNKPDLEFVYDANGNRITKIVKTRGNFTNQLGVLDPESFWTYTYYVRDASGNTMGVYEQQSPAILGPNNYKTTFKQKELNLYGSSRIGIFNADRTLVEREFSANIIPQTGVFDEIVTTTLNIAALNPNLTNRTLGKKVYELSNHLGNVLAVVSDKRFPQDDGTYNNLGVQTSTTPDGIIDFYDADLVSANDYYPFGMVMPNRNFSSPSYRYGFNGKEKDDEVSGNGNSYNYGFRIYNPRLGKFLSVDPLAGSYPWYSPYHFAGNRPIVAIDLDGLEEWIIVKWTDNNNLLGLAIMRVSKESYIKSVNKEMDRLVNLENSTKALNNNTFRGRQLRSANQRVDENIAWLNNERLLRLQEIEDNYNKTIVLNKDGTIEETQTFLVQSAELGNIDADPYSYVQGKTLLDKSEVAVRDQLILDQGLANVAALSTEDAATYASFLETGAVKARIPQSIQVNFATNSFELSQVDKESLDNLYVAMQIVPDLKVALVGYTDSDGSPGDNQALSERRANSARDYLIGKGINQNRITASGKGEANPVGDNDTEGGRAANRRIDIVQE